MDWMPLAEELKWPVAIAIAWVAGEFAHRWLSLPRISIYGLSGFLMAHAGWLSHSGNDAMVLLANFAFGLILFEFGYRINVRWLRVNRWIAVTSLVESFGSFIAVYFLAHWYGASTIVSLLLASLAMSTSPAGILRIINEERSSGQVTERILHLSAFNCVLAVFMFKVIVGLWTFQSSGDLGQAVSSSLLVLGASVVLGVLFGIAVPGFLRRMGNLSRDATLAFAIAVILLVMLTYTLKLSPVLAALAFGFMARYRRVSLSQAERNFGTLGNLLTVVLFVFIATTIEWHRVMSGIQLALLLIGVRFAAKVVAVTLFSKLSGISWRKGMLTGVALTPISVFVILMLEQTRYIGVDLIDQLAALAAATLILETVGPVLTQRALIWAGESSTNRES